MMGSPRIHQGMLERAQRCNWRHDHQRRSPPNKGRQAVQRLGSTSLRQTSNDVVRSCLYMERLRSWRW